MHVINKIDNLISELTELKPQLSADVSANQKNFNDLLTKTIANTNKDTKEIISPQHSDHRIPDWVDLDYGYDPLNPRKPNMRELIEGMSGKNIEDLYAESDENSLQEISSQAAEILYGVVGENEDNRDWLPIMASEDILTAAREQTGVMYNPEVDIKSNFDETGLLIEQMAVIKDSEGNTLRSLSSDLASTNETLLNFGITKTSIPTNLEDRINPEKFDDDLLAFLKNFDNKPTSIQQVVVQSASEVIANKISQEIPLDELAKL